MDIFLSIVLTLLIIFLVPIIVYSLFVKYAGLKEPDKKLSFMVSVLIQKIGTAIGFVTLYLIGRTGFEGSWIMYGMIWAVMFTIVEIGQAVGPDYSKKEAAAGIISELVYFPLAAFAIAKLLS